MICILRKLAPVGVVLGCGLFVACGDDTVSGASMSDSATGVTASTTEAAPGTLDDTGVATEAGTGTGSDTGIDPDSTGTDTDTGPAVEPGHGGGEFVNAGTYDGMSPGYHLLFTFGQGTQNQSTMTSPGYRLRGGFVPATQ